MVSRRQGGTRHPDNPPPSCPWLVGGDWLGGVGAVRVPSPAAGLLLLRVRLVLAERGGAGGTRRLPGRPGARAAQGPPRADADPGLRRLRPGPRAGEHLGVRSGRPQAVDPPPRRPLLALPSGTHGAPGTGGRRTAGSRPGGERRAAPVLDLPGSIGGKAGVTCWCCEAWNGPTAHVVWTFGWTCWGVGLVAAVVTVCGGGWGQGPCRPADGVGGGFGPVFSGEFSREFRVDNLVIGCRWRSLFGWNCGVWGVGCGVWGGGGRCSVWWGPGCALVAVGLLPAQGHHHPYDGHGAGPSPADCHPSSGSPGGSVRACCAVVAVPWSPCPPAGGCGPDRARPGWAPGRAVRGGACCAVVRCRSGCRSGLWGLWGCVIGVLFFLVAGCSVGLWGV